MSSNLSPYHIAYAMQSNEEIEDIIARKRHELQTIFNKIEYTPTKDQLNIAVFGCADARLIPGHEAIFRELLHKEIDLFTFDIVTDHLPQNNHVIKHDCTVPLTHTHYDIIYSHVLLKFIHRNKQFPVLSNSYEALDENGIAIHIMHNEEIDTPDEEMEDGYYSVPLTTYEKILEEEEIPSTIIDIPDAKALVLFSS